LAQQLALLRDVKGDGSLPQTIWSGVIPSNMMALVGFSTGELYAAYYDYSAQTLNLGMWPNIDTNPNPIWIAPIAGAGAANNQKITLLADEAGRRVNLIGTAGCLFAFNDAGGIIGSQQLFNPGLVHYNAFRQQEDGSAHMVLCSAVTAPSGHPQYSVTGIMAPNLRDVGTSSVANWYGNTGNWPGGTPLVLPFDATPNGPGIGLERGDELISSDVLLIDSDMRDGILRLATMETTAFGELGLARDDLAHLTVNVSTGPWSSSFYATPNRHRALKAMGAAGEVYARCDTGGVQIRADGDHWILANRDSLLHYKSTNGGESWTLESATPVGWGSDMIHQINVFRDDYDSTILRGTVTRLNITPTGWVVPGANPQAAVYAWSLS
jgi:hypothetical protein